MTEPGPPPKPAPALIERLVRVSAIGTDFAFAVIGMGVLGFAIDYFAGTGRVALITAVLIGLVVGFYRFIREALAANRAAMDDQRRRRPTFREITDEPPPPPDDPER